MKDKPVWQSLPLLAILVFSSAFMGVTRTSADNPTPSSGPVTPEVTPLATVATPPATSFPTVVREASTPIATSLEVPTAAPTAIPTSADSVQIPTAIPTIEPTPVAQSAVTAPPPAVSWPSPDQLRQNALLRWGATVPSSVRRWAFLIVPAARKNHLDPNLIAAVMTMESNGDPTAWSAADARGLMQILHGPWDPRLNVNKGARLLAKLFAAYGDWTLVLAAYNAGPAAVGAFGGVPPYRETRDYVIIVSYLWDLYSRHQISLARRSLYGRSLNDLRSFLDQRKKVKKLAQIGQVPEIVQTGCGNSPCTISAQSRTYETLDPFWPVGGAPDPLQRVGPYIRKP
jgi:Transglycosylase SLT domain